MLHHLAIHATTVRDLAPGEAGVLDAVLGGMSARSRYQRYHGPKPRLSAAERAYLAGADGRDQVALVASDGPRPVAVARSVRTAPGEAEIAAEVVDDRQRQGLGSDLIARLARRAARNGIERFTATVLSSTGLRAMLVRRGWRVRSFDGITTTLEIDVWTLLSAPPRPRPRRPRGRAPARRGRPAPAGRPTS
ncbi:MAG: hypothetical protein QOE28_2273 [Solirubrobacteraceae bacterium]|nr:hypothetical protein [Solirubrobacteraceae bacterium]